MRLRPIAALSVAALSALVLAGCSGSASPDATPSASPADLCAAAVSSGAATDAVSVAGDFGAEPTVTFTSPLEVTDVESSVLDEGDGENIAAGDFVQFALTEYNAETGEKNGSVGYTPASALPLQVSAESVLGQILGCSPVGSRLVATLPGSESAPASIDVIDILSVVPTAAWGEEQAPTDGFPTVDLADDGEPSVSIPDADPPTETQITVLKKGDGPAVAAGDTTLLQYYGVDWATGESFDSSWSKGTPYYNQGNQYVPGFVKALDGQTVGSQVLVVIPPADAYGEKSDANTSELAGETLVFVIDILATQHAATP